MHSREFLWDKTFYSSLLLFLLLLLLRAERPANVIQGCFAEVPSPPSHKHTHKKKFSALVRVVSKFLSWQEEGEEEEEKEEEEERAIWLLRQKKRVGERARALGASAKWVEEEEEKGRKWICRNFWSTTFLGGGKSGERKNPTKSFLFRQGILQM